jgi:hypothetical protein
MSSISVNKLAASLISQYDTNGNNQIDLGRRVAGNNNRNESSRFEKNYLTGDFTEFSRGDLFKDADKAGFKDKKVTKEELEKFIGFFDKDGDGVLSSRGIDGMLKGKPLGEYETFLREYEEIQLSDGVKKF